VSCKLLIDGLSVLLTMSHLTGDYGLDDCILSSMCDMFAQIGFHIMLVAGYY